MMAAPAPAPAAAPAPPATTTAGGPLGATLQPVAGLPPPDLSLPALEAVKNRETYRTRPDDELEEATWYSAEEPDTLVEPSKIRLRSIHSKQPTAIMFANKSPHRVRALWIDFAGNEVVYSVLEPNTTRRYHTYQTHPWIVRELRSGTRMVLSGRPAVVGLSADQTVDISAPPQLEWSLATHACFPEPYKASIRGLIQAHKQLEAHAGASTATAPTAAPPSCSSPLGALKLSSSSPSPAPAGPPCSPRGTLTLLQQEATSPKALRLSHSPAAPPCCSPRPSRAGAYTPTDVTTTISIRSDARHFTLTLSSPTRANMKQMVNIEVVSSSSAVPAGGAACGLQGCCHAVSPSSACAGDDAMQTDDQDSLVAAAGPSSSSRGTTPGRKKTPRTKHGLFNSLMHNFKTAFSSRSPPGGRSARSPSPFEAAPASTTHIKVHLESMLQSQDAATTSANSMEIDTPPARAEAGGPAWPPAGTHLGDLPNHLLAHIAELSAPTTYQTMDQPPPGRPLLLPCLLACPPRTAEEEAAAQDEEEDDDGPPPLI